LIIIGKILDTGRKIIMRKDKMLISLSHDHFHGILLSQILKKNAPPYNDMPEGLIEKVKCTIPYYHTDLIRHFKYEEELLYPLVKGIDSTIDMLFERLIEEHKILNEMMIILRTNANPEEDMDKLGYFLEAHIRKEERALFPKIELVVSYEKLIEIDKRIFAVRQNEIKEK